MADLLFPFSGNADHQTPTPAAGAAAVTVYDNVTIVDVGTLDAALTLTVTADAEIRIGAVLVVKAASDGTGRNVTFAGDALGIAISGTANKTKTKLFVWDGTNFLGISGEQIN